MKYLIEDQVINSDHIVRAIYRAQSIVDSRCEITLTSISTPELDNGPKNDAVLLRGKQADRFWDAYIGDAYTIVSPRADV